MRVTISLGIGSLLSVMASHARRSTNFGADALPHLVRATPAHGHADPSRGVLQNRVWIGFQFQHSSIPATALATQPRQPQPSASRPSITLATISPHLSCRPVRTPHRDRAAHRFWWRANLSLSRDHAREPDPSSLVDALDTSTNPA